MKETQQSVIFRFLESKNLLYAFTAIYAMIMTFVSITYHKVGDYGVETDFFHRFVPAAKSFLNGSVSIDDFHGPLYPILLGVFYLFTDDYMIAGQLINVIGISVFLLTIALVFRSMYSSLIGLIAFFLVATNVHVIRHVYSSGTDMLFLGLLGAMIYYLLIERTYRLKNIILVGVFSGLAFLTRFNGLFVILGVLLSIWLINIYALPLKRRLMACLIVLVLFLGIYSPYGIYTSVERGSFFI